MAYTDETDRYSTLAGLETARARKKYSYTRPVFSG